MVANHQITDQVNIFFNERDLMRFLNDDDSVVLRDSLADGTLMPPEVEDSTCNCHHDDEDGNYGDSLAPHMTVNWSEWSGARQSISKPKQTGIEEAYDAADILLPPGFSPER